jgi:hypothetical protein
MRVEILWLEVKKIPYSACYFKKRAYTVTVNMLVTMHDDGEKIPKSTSKM